MSTNSVPVSTLSGASSTSSQKGEGQPVKRKLFLILLGLLIISGLLGFLFFNLKNDKLIKAPQEEQPPIDLKQVKFSATAVQRRIEETLNNVLGEKDKEKQSELSETLFTDIRGIYEQNHDSATRKQLELLGAYIEKNFPSQYQKQKDLYAIPCLDNECGQASYPSQIIQIKEQLTDSKLDQKILESILKNFEGAAFTKDGSKQWAYYLNSFNMLKSQFETKKDPQIKKIAQSLKDFMENQFPNEFKVVEKAKPESLEL